jgi:hypothetical protein
MNLRLRTSARGAFDAHLFSLVLLYCTRGIPGHDPTNHYGSLCWGISAGACDSARDGDEATASESRQVGSREEVRFCVNTRNRDRRLKRWIQRKYGTTELLSK